MENKTILIIEDDRFISRVYVKWLSNAGAKVRIASNGIQGLQLIDEGGIDLVLLDLGMPGLNGYETLKQIRQKPGMSTLPIIIMSNTTLKDGSEEAKQIKSAGVTEVLRKYETSLADISKSITKYFPPVSSTVKN
jgi:two-component system, chemotaxis family, sensor kinase CheA